MKKYTWAPAVAIALAFAIFLSRNRNHAQPENAGPTTAKADVISIGPQTPAALIARDQQAKSLRGKLEKDESSDDRFMNRLQLFRRFSKKVLKTDEEAILYQQLLEDSKTQAQALASLEPGTAEEVRMVLVDYLASALTNDHNSGRSDLSERVENFLASELPKDIHDKKMIRSLAADRIELFTIVQEVDNEAARRLVAAPKSELNKRILQYAIANYGKKGG